MASRIRSAKASLTKAELLVKAETVATETCARRATSWMVQAFRLRMMADYRAKGRKVYSETIILRLTLAAGATYTPCRFLPYESCLRYFFACFSAFYVFLANAQTTAIPTGYDAYRQWARWPYQRIGMRAYMRSTYDRRGGDELADASHFLYQLADDRNVTLDVRGAGMSLFCPLQPLARQPMALRSGRAGPHRGREQHCRSAASRREFHLHPEGAFSRTPRLYVVNDQGCGPFVGTDRIFAIVPHGVLANFLWNRRPHLRPFRGWHKALATNPSMGWKNSASERCAGSPGAGGRAISRLQPGNGECGKSQGPKLI